MSTTNRPVTRAIAAQRRLVARLLRHGWKPMTATRDPGMFSGPHGVLTVPREAVCRVEHDAAALVLISTVMERLAGLEGLPVAALREEVFCG